MNSGHLTLLLGCMFAQKTTELIRRIRRFQSIGYDVFVINFIGDDRYSIESSITSHDQLKVSAVKVRTLSEIENKVNLLTDSSRSIIVIDEGQFFPDLLEYVVRWTDIYGLRVIVAGLSGDINRRPFGQILSLIPHAEEFVQLTALCSKCKDGTLAQFTIILDSTNLSTIIPNEEFQNSNNHVHIGGSECYFPVCRKHFLESQL